MYSTHRDEAVSVYTLKHDNLLFLTVTEQAKRSCKTKELKVRLKQTQNRVNGDIYQTRCRPNGT